MRDAASVRWILLGILLGSSPAFGAMSFIRGDTDSSGTVDLSDAVGVFNYLFLGGGEPTCLAAADADDSRIVDITDGIYILQYLFLGGFAPPAPFPECARQPGVLDITCLHFAACEAREEDACRAAGGVVRIERCCQAVSDFAGNCGTGGCTCHPSWEHDVLYCDCGEGMCWDGEACVEAPWPPGAD